jgi:hypothetical protein
MDKLGRTYFFSVQIDSDYSVDSPYGNSLSVLLPTTIEFDISRNFLGGGANHATFRIYNLAADSRNDVRFDIDNFGETRIVSLIAGYGKSVYQIFTGTLMRAHSIREGVNFITTFECQDNNFIYTNAFFSGQFLAGTSMSSQFSNIIAQFPKDNNGNTLVSVGAIGSFPQTNPRPTTYNKPSVALLKEISDNKFFIDNGKAHVLNNNEYISTGNKPLMITPQTGLLATPQLEDANLTIDVLFEPRLQVGNLIQIQSSTDTKFNNRTWRVNCVKHRGMISGAVCGEVVTTIQVTYSKQTFIPVALVA